MSQFFSSPLLNVSLLALFWALQIFTSKLGFQAGAELFTFTIQSLVVISIMLGLYVLPQKLDSLRKLSLKIFFALLFVNVLGSGLGGTFSNAGIQLTTAINAGFLFQFDIALTIIFAWLLLKEKLDVTKILMLILILIGTFLLTTNGQWIVPHLGDIFILLASAFFALTTVLLRKLFKGRDLDPDIASFFRPLVGLSFLLLIVASSPLYPTEVQHLFVINLFDFRYIVYVFFTSLFVVGTLVFLNRTLKIASASYTAMMASVTPIIVAILAFVFLQETMSLIQAIGALFIVAASFVTHVVKVDKH